ncbi:MAG: Sensor histidine kinase RcsC [Chroococcidiopsis sp. SAG 2025]|uniref:PAS domain S-box protein n=1 Tax=Chroococcidiopsis sp. SAG 2025 TaxID=171389 RepID=UPI0029370697|nr:PAS domain S-box protein [Chroococcidiopsis sp. SAG 2025]MDV2991579.1 Sensor histidine kinase RcsC [Chroococcidiopsis sp. SAG 2025]
MTQHRTVLIVDCCAPDREIYREYLLEDQEVKYKILEAESGQSGLLLCQSRSLDGILLEYQLPDLDGLAFLTTLRQQAGEDCPPVVMVTGHGNEAIAVKALKNGAVDYLVKGQATADELRQAVGSAIANTQLRQKLQASEQRFQTSVENLLDCFGIYSSIRDESGRIVDFQVEYVNAAACEQNCMTQEQQIGRRLCELLPAHKDSGLFEEYCQVVETGKPLIKESLDYTDIYGDRCLNRAYDIRISRLNDGFVAAWRDVTARKQAEIEREKILAQEKQVREAAERNKQQYRLLAAKLRESDRRFRAIFNSTFQMIGSLSPEGILLEVNQTALDFAGVAKEEVIDRPFWETKWWTISPEIQARLREAIEQAAAGEFVRYEVDVLSAGDRVATIDFSLKPVFDETGQVVLLIPEGRDISDKKQAEATLRDVYAQLEQRAAALTQSNQNLQVALEELQISQEELNQQNEELIQARNLSEIQTQRYQDLFNFAPDGYLVTNCQGIIQEANRAITSLLAIDQQQLIGKPLNAFVAPQEMQVFWRQLNRFAAKANHSASAQLIQTWELNLKPFRGKPFPAEVSLAAIDNGQEDLVGWRWLIRDITQRKQAEAALRQSEALFRGVFESDLIGILFWNAEGQIIDANETFCRMTGYSRQEMQAGQVRYKNITPPEYHATDAQKLETIQTTGQYAPFEKEYICKDGSRIPILLGCAFLPGYSDRGVAFVLDISEKKRWEREREALLAKEQLARKEAERADRSKDEFLAMVSHELRSPLNSILGWAKLLRTRKYDPQVAARALETIERNAQAQSQLLEDLLDVSRMIRGNLRLTLAPVNLLNVVDSTVTSLKLAAQAKNIDLQFGIQNSEFRSRSVASASIPNSPFMVSGDLHRLQQIVTNLLTNAIKFTPNGGRVEISLKRVEQGAEGEKPRTKHYPITNYQLPITNYPKFAQIQVTDTGQGISPEFLPYIFERFRQADDVTTRSKDGLGLGLAIARHLVELHRGTIAAASLGEGQGATFTVTIPLLETRQGDGEDKKDKEDKGDLPLQGIRILVVDDDADARDFLHFALTLEEAEVKVARSAKEALEILNQFQPNVIVSDIGMPEEDGYSLLRQVRSQTAARGGEPIFAIALTAFARESDRQSAIAAGFQRHLAKPVVVAELVAAIANLIQS